MTTQPREEHLVADVFNAMAEEYDCLLDVWYPHFFKSIEKILNEHLPPPSRKDQRSLDVGCGTGNQSYVMRALGYDVTGIDIAQALIDKAKAKNRDKDPHIRFQVASATRLPFKKASFQAVVCCGGVLSFLPDAKRALNEIFRVLKPGGYCLIEADARWNLDLFWGLADHLMGGKFGFEQAISTALKNLGLPLNRGIDVRYPFPLLSGETEYMYSHLFTCVELKRACESSGFQIIRQFAIHSVSNVLPSTWMSRADLPNSLVWLLRPLLKLDQELSGYFPFRNLGNSVVFLLRKPTLQKNRPASQPRHPSN